MRVLTWNLFHGRSQPPSGRSLEDEFAQRIATWEWDVALLQEVPPWWPPVLARRSGAQQRTALTSRNSMLALRRAIAQRRPDLIKSNGGGANAVLVRGPITADRRLMLRRWPERRVAQLLRLETGLCVINLHGSTRVALATQELERITAVGREWARGAPLVIGGDLNLRTPDAAALGLVGVGGHSVDHVLARGLLPVGEPRFPDRSVQLDGARVELSDHWPLVVEVAGGGGF